MASLGRWLALSVIGGVALFMAVARWGGPARTEERSGWLYQQFGDQGVVLGAQAMNRRERLWFLVFLVVGILAGVALGVGLPVWAPMLAGGP